MDKIAYLLLFAVSAALSAQAGPVTETAARQKALEARLSVPRKAPASASGDIELVYAPAGADGQTDFYVFNYGGDSGFVIIAGDDNARSVLARGDKGHFDAEDIPCNVAWWLGNYQREMAVLRANPHYAYHAGGVFPEVAPMLSTQWNQRDPFNLYCPTYVDSYGYTEHCVTGCVATATAQIMNYHKWPAQGKGSHSYYCHINKGEDSVLLSADFNHAYHWDRMRNYYEYYGTQEQIDAVARLMSDVGIAVEMGYGSSSWAYSYMVSNVLFKYFGYDPRMLYLTRNDSTPGAWEMAMARELQQGRPIAYSGNGDQGGGHAFVVDGCSRDGLFHINWGWGGRYDNYFALSLLDPGSYNYTSNQFATIGIRPDTLGGWHDAVGMFADFRPDAAVVQLGDTAFVSCHKASVRGELNWKVMSWGLILTDATGRRVIDNIYCCSYDQGETPKYSDYWSMGWNVTEMTCFLPENMPQGRYRLYLAWSGDMWESQHIYYGPQWHPGYITIDVRDGMAYLSLSAGVPGDVTGDGKVDVADTNALVNIIIGAGPTTEAADIDSSGTVDVADLNALINIILAR